jgi:hypothetical protein
VRSLGPADAQNPASRQTIKGHLAYLKPRGDPFTSLVRRVRRGFKIRVKRPAKPQWFPAISWRAPRLLLS